MSTGTTIGVVVAVLVALAVAAVLLKTYLQRRHLRRKFGPEYQRAVERNGNRMAAERELAERERAHAKLDLRALDEGTRENYVQNWAKVQEMFVDAPAEAVGQADRLVTALMAERGYPTEGYEQRMSLLSVEHARTLADYRAAHAISQRQDRGEATTEDLRNAMVHYRALFEELLGRRREGAR
ncbi:hypothetical protein [Saccharothrix coeruleofusca]|uniref:Secreted protein n=1 Tax=Saccharothrix coeruleofusca TaxID=33919 RepID=A0A918EC23_9PSEU|nr:hypothetical protein [Saccharothrix coeruleofusca]MBP2334502.1 hypothetical protein [Saccharothrix coeruleofusca]GGP40572.1 hypothetical protein GCM10010185_09540 [Saccharothrix coeruleofusca]